MQFQVAVVGNPERVPEPSRDEATAGKARLRLDAIPIPRRVGVLVLFLSGAACIIPPGPATIPASGVSGQPRASMTAARVKGESPFKDAYWVVDSESNARRTAERWRARRPADAAALDKIAAQPSAAWMGNWNPQIEMDVKLQVLPKTRAGGLPVLILYNLPFRDCGSYSAGGAGSPEG